MTRITLEDAQRRLPELIASAIPGEEIEIIQDDRTIARLVTVAQSPADRCFGSAKGSILYMADDFDAPLDDFKDYM
jgi:antitoxin (DNA-binding transcriptional repressor) of toxin-antitoxin stability system